MNRVVVLVSLIAIVLGQTVPLFPLQKASEYRSHDGSGNNVANPTRGAAGQVYQRIGNSFAYANGVSEPRCGGIATNFTCPNERDIGLQFFTCPTCVDPQAGSDWAWATGLYLAIDTTRTVGASPTESFPITVPQGDPHFPALAFTRQAHTADQQATPRTQTNAVSAFLDAHPIYGVNDNFNSVLRSGVNGTLSMQIGTDGLEYPILVGNGTFPAGVNWANLANNVATGNLFRFGDARGNQNPVLMTVQILWMREHNRIARLIADKEPTLNDTIIYQEARRRVIALMQHFYESEYIPMLLGKGPTTVPGTYTGYDAAVDPSLDQFFASVALRYGHIQVSSETLRIKEDGSALASMILKDNFFDPTIIAQDGIDVIMKGLNHKQHNTGEVSMADDLRNHLYAKKGSVGLDLASLNMRRAREIGLPNYAAARAAYGLPATTSFNETISDPALVATLVQIYGANDPSLCDPWLCGIIEDSVNQGELGPLFFVAILNQFNRLRTGDRFWYDQSNQFSADELSEIKKTKLVDIIFRNSNIETLSCDVFEVKGTDCRKNPLPNDAVAMSGSIFVILAVILALLF